MDHHIKKKMKTVVKPHCLCKTIKKKKMWYIHTMEYYSAIKKNEIMPFAATWMDLEIVILSDVRQRQISYDIAYMWTLKKMIQINLFTKQKQTHRLRKQTYGYQRGKVGGEG